MPSPRTINPRLVLAICSLSAICVGIDNTIVNIALPTLRHDLHASFAGAQWAVDAYQIVLGALLISSGAIADRWGRRRTLQTGLSVFAVGSLLCSAAPSIGWLIGFRVLQASGASMMNPVAMALVSTAYTDRERRARAFGIWSAAYGLSMAIGPTVGGLLVGVGGWRSVFWVTAPVAILCIAGTARYVQESRPGRSRGLDPLGQLLLCGSVALLAFVIIDGGDLQRSLLVALVCVLILAVAVFLIWEAHHPEPLIELRFFRSIPFSAAVAIALIGAACSGGYLWVMSFFLQSSRGLSAESAGLVLVVGAATVVLVAPLAGQLAASRGPRLPLVISGFGFALSGLLLLELTRTTPIVVLLASLMAYGIGWGMLNAPVNNVALRGMPPERSGVAAAIASTGRQLGQALGVAIIGVIVTRGLTGDVAARLPAATHNGWWAVLIGGVAVSGLALAGTTDRALASAKRVRESELHRREHETNPQVVSAAH